MQDRVCWDNNDGSRRLELENYKRYRQVSKCDHSEDGQDNQLDNKAYCAQSQNREQQLPRTLGHQQVGEEAVVAQHDWESSWMKPQICRKIKTECCIINLLRDDKRT